MLTIALHQLLKPLNKFIDIVGIACGVVLLLFICNVFYDVVTRYLFDNVSIALQELEWHLFAIMFMFGIGYTLKENAHVRVDILYTNFSAKTQAIIDLIGSFLLALPICLLIVYDGYSYAFDAWQIGEGSPDPGGLPHRWIIRAVIPTSFAYVSLCVLQVILTKIEVLLNPKQPERG